MCLVCNAPTFGGLDLESSLSVYAGTSSESSHQHISRSSGKGQEQKHFYHYLPERGQRQGHPVNKVGGRQKNPEGDFKVLLQIHHDQLTVSDNRDHSPPS